MNGSKVIAGAALSIILAGCASQSSSILVGKARPEISPDAVKLYIDPPKRYEKVALIEANSKAAPAWSSQAKSDVVVQRLKEQAAKIGANGVLLQQTSDQMAGAAMPSTTYRPAAPGGVAFGTGIAVPIMQKAGSGIAIFVEEE